MGILIISKDGKTDNEFGNIRFKYNKMKYLKKFDFYYPNELEIKATKGNEKIYLNFKNISESFEDIFTTTGRKIIRGFAICQVPCKVDGYYINGTKKVNIGGTSKVEFHRLLSILGHNSLSINFELTKNCCYIISHFNSHYFRKKISFKLQFLPKPSLKIRFKKLIK
jgi:hypothetical protein